MIGTVYPNLFDELEVLPPVNVPHPNSPWVLPGSTVRVVSCTKDVITFEHVPTKVDKHGRRVPIRRVRNG